MSKPDSAFITYILHNTDFFYPVRSAVGVHALSCGLSCEAFPALRQEQAFLSINPLQYHIIHTPIIFPSFFLCPLDSLRVINL